MAASSSSSDEDLSLFQSVAVTADNIAESARKEAVAGRRKSASAVGTPEQPGQTAGGRGPKGNAAAEGQSRNGEQLDMTSLKIAAALDALLAKRLEVTSTPPAAEMSSSSLTVAAAGAAGASAAPACGPVDVQAPSTAADRLNAAGDTDLDTTGIRLFKRVRPGAACVITNTEYGDLTEVDPSKSHLDPGSQQHLRLRDLIPRYCLAASSSKQQHDQTLAALAVDGNLLLQAAAAATGTAWQQQQQQQQRSPRQQNPAANAGGGGGGGGTLAAWQYLKKRKADGLVMNAKEFVPHDARIAKLLRLPLPG